MKGKRKVTGGTASPLHKFLHPPLSALDIHTLTYGCETWTLTDNSLHTIGVFLSVAGVRALNVFNFSAK